MDHHVKNTGAQIVWKEEKTKEKVSFSYYAGNDFLWKKMRISIPLPAVHVCKDTQHNLDPKCQVLKITHTCLI